MLYILFHRKRHPLEMSQNEIAQFLSALAVDERVSASNQNPALCAILCMRDKIRRRQYIVTHHARKEMNEDGFTIYDVERGILTGEILERQRDRTTGEAKYRTRGKTIEGVEVEILTKLSPMGKMVIITV